MTLRWLTLSEIADAALPGLPATRRGMAALSVRDGWAAIPGKSRVRPGRGGAREYSLDLLPLEARAAWLRQQTTMPVVTMPARLPSDDKVTGKDRIRRDARLHVVIAAERYAVANRLGLRVGDSLYSDGYNAGVIEVPAWVRAEIGKISRASIQRWRSLRAEEGDDALGHDGRGTRALDNVLGGEVKSHCVAVLVDKPLISARQMRAYISETFGDRLPSIPCVREVQRAIARWSQTYANEIERLRDPDGYRSRTEFTAVNATRADGLNDLWQIDASPADVMLHGKRRHSVYVAIDVWSRRTKVLVTETPRAAAVAMLIRKCILAWGVPNRIKTDNGSDFTAVTTQRLIASLGITAELSPPYQPKTKGMVERVIGTFQRDLATCPGFIGHSVADRKIIESRKAFARRLGATEVEIFDVEMDLPEFQTWCDSWTEIIYGHQVHSALKGLTPFQKAASWAEPIRRIEHVEALDVLLAPIAGNGGIRTVTKTGVRVDHHHYYTSAAMPGTEVLVRMDPTDMGRVMLFAPDGETWLGVALCPELAGLDPVTTIQQVKAAQKAFEKEQLTDIQKARRKIGPRAVADALLRDGQRRAASLVAFPARGEAYTTPALDAAAEAARMRRAPEPRQADSGEQERRRAFVAEFRPAPDPVVEMKPKDRFRRALALEAEIEAGRTVDEADAAWLRVYQTLPEYRAHQRVVEERGRAWLA